MLLTESHPSADGRRLRCVSDSQHIVCILTIRKTLAPTRSVTQMFKKIKKLLSVDGPTKVFESESPQKLKNTLNVPVLTVGKLTRLKQEHMNGRICCLFLF